MAVEERLAHVEGRVEGQAQMLTDVGVRLVALDQKFDRKFDVLEAKFDRRFDALDSKISSSVRWMVWIQFTILVALLASFIAG